MGEVTDLHKIRALILDLNPCAKEQDIRIYADAFIDYVSAIENIRRNGTICAHPRTGQPMENPYLKVKAGAITTMAKAKTVTATDLLWEDYAD